MSRKAQLKEGSARSGQQGFDHKTAADFLNGKTVSDEAVRTFVAASRWAHDERAALSATLLAMHGVLTSREAEIALLKKALLEAEAAPQPASTAGAVDALCDSQYAAGMLLGWNLCTAGDDETFRKIRGQRMTAALAAQGGKA